MKKLLILCFALAIMAQFMSLFGDVLIVDPMYSGPELHYDNPKDAIRAATAGDTIVLFPITAESHADFLTNSTICLSSCNASTSITPTSGFTYLLTTTYIRMEQEDVTMGGWEEHIITLEPMHPTFVDVFDIVRSGAFINLRFVRIKFVFVPSDQPFSLRRDIRVFKTYQNDSQKLADISDVVFDHSVFQVTNLTTSPATLIDSNFTNVVFKGLKVPIVFHGKIHRTIRFHNTTLSGTVESNSTAHFICTGTTHVVNSTDGSIITILRGAFQKLVEVLPDEDASMANPAATKLTNCPHDEHVVGYDRFYHEEVVFERIIDEGIATLKRIMHWVIVLGIIFIILVLIGVFICCIGICVSVCLEHERISLNNKKDNDNTKSEERVRRVAAVLDNKKNN